MASFVAAYRIGMWELNHDAALIDPARAEQASGELGHWLCWIQNASGPIALGVLTISASAALIGYVVSSIVWRWWTARKWRRRAERHAAGH